MTQLDERTERALEYMRHQGAKGLSELDALMERTAGDWAQCLDGMGEGQATFKPAARTGPAAEDEWCAKEVIGHLLVTNRSLNRDIATMAGVKPPVATSEQVRAMGAVSGDEEARPIAELRQRIATVYDESRRLLTSLQEDDKLKQGFPHPLFGPLNLKEWFAFHRVHAMDHIQQIDKIKADPAYPKA